MTDRILSVQHLNAFQEYLQREEKSAATVEKYLRDVRAFVAFAEGRSITKEVTIAFKKELEDRQYAVRSINSMLASLNSYQVRGCCESKETGGRASKRIRGGISFLI